VSFEKGRIIRKGFFVKRRTGVVWMERRILWKKRVNEYFLGGFIKRCRLSWLTNSGLVYEHKCGGRGGEFRGHSQ
jgi:hypothetical protein